MFHSGSRLMRSHRRPTRTAYIFNATKKYSSVNTVYRDVENKLNAIYTSSLTNEKLKNYTDTKCLILMRQLLKRVAITQNDLKNLNIIHVAGTKGKGSTCAFVESVLRHNGYKTGLYTSPHLVHVQERFKIGGESLKKDEFSKYFIDVYLKLEATKNDFEIHLPLYFHFLTLMSFHVFMQEKVDVAIIEAGIGGMYDCTNVVETPLVCGITSLGLDHTDLLGNTLPSIAWHKGGILKNGIKCFTTSQPEEAMKVLRHRASEVNSPMKCAPDFSSYITENKQIKLGLDGNCQYKNASLALQLSQHFIDHKHGISKISNIEEFAPPFHLTKKHINGLEKCTWRGRAQTLKFEGITFYLDVAHTSDSMQYCAEWFEKESKQEQLLLQNPCTRLLIFNVTRQRDTKSMFQKLVNCNLQHIVFVPTEGGDMEPQYQEVFENHKTWLQLKHDPCDLEQQTSILKNELHKNNHLQHNISSKTTLFTSMANALNWLSRDRDLNLSTHASKFCTFQKPHYLPCINPSSHLQILVTGSVHLVGEVLRITDTLNK